MFASLKNRIKEETGSDLSKLTAKITSSTVQRIDSLRGRSQQGSTSSLNSIVSSEGARDETRAGGGDVEEYRKRFAKIEQDFARKLENKEAEWREIVLEKDRLIRGLEGEKEEAQRLIASLQESLKSAQEFKQKILDHKENSDQIETLQSQELQKVKQLVLLREKELAEKASALKEANSQLEKLRGEVARLRRQEEQLSDVQDNVKTELKVVRKNLENSESELDKTGDECSKLKLSVDSEHLANNSLRQLITKLEKELNEEKSNSLNVQKTLSRVTSEKNSALLRNAEISQQMEMVRQDMRRQEKEMTELLSKLSQLEEQNEKLLDNRKVEQQLKATVSELEDQIMEKNKNIKTLQLRLADMKKTLQHELRTPGHPSYHSDLIDNSTSAILMPSQNSTRSFANNAKRDDDDVNFKYLKHVIIKFLTSDYEAQHLIKAISTLLKFTPDEEKLIQETLEWKRSWFGSKPKTAAAQKSKALPS